MFKIDNSFSNANVSRTIRFTEQMLDELQQLAQDYEISFNALVLQCCQYALDNMETEKQPE